MLVEELVQVIMTLWTSYNLGIDCAVFTLQCCSVAGNLFIIYLFYSTEALRKNDSLKLMLVMSIFDLLFAICVFPIIFYFAINWNPTGLDYNGYVVNRLIIPLIVEAKMYSIMTIGVAIDRIQAMRWPIYYVRKNHTRYVAAICAIGGGFALFDLILQQTHVVERSPGCASIACFTKVEFRVWWGTSHTMLNLSLLPLTMIVGYEIQKFSVRFGKGVGACVNPSATAMYSGSSLRDRIAPFFAPRWKAGNKVSAAKAEAAAEQTSYHNSPFVIQMGEHELNRKKNFRTTQMNRLSFSILVTTLLLVLMPSAIVNVAQLLQCECGRYFGPVYIMGILLASVCNIFIYIKYHASIRSAAFRAFSNCPLCPRRWRGAASKMMVATVTPSSVQNKHSTMFSSVAARL